MHYEEFQIHCVATKSKHELKVTILSNMHSEFLIVNILLLCHIIFLRILIQWDAMSCMAYRGVKLLEHAMKIVEKVLERRLQG